MSVTDASASATAHGVHGLPPTDTGATVSTSALVVEVSQLRYALRARTVRSAAATDGEFRAVLRRRDALLRELRRRGLDFPEERVDPTTILRGQAPATPEPDVAPEPGLPVILADLAAKVEQLEHGIARRTVIGQAQGILIERQKVTADGAFALLVRSSSVTNRKLYDIALELVLTGELPGPR